jgi:hypothetical protein
MRGEERVMPVVTRTPMEWEKSWHARIFATQALRQGEEIVVGWRCLHIPFSFFFIL